MPNDDLKGERRGGLSRLVGVTISTMLVTQYVVLGAAIIIGRLLLGVAGEARRRLSSSRNGQPDAATPTPEAA